MWRATQVALDDPEAGLPYWAVAWGGGLALARYVRDHPAVVAGRRVFDLGSGSGVCAIVAAQADASSVVAADVDPLAIAAIGLNARANRVRVTTIHRDVLPDDPPDVDVILAGDCCYDALITDRVMAWLDLARATGIEVLLGDPGRRHLRTDRLVEVATYHVRSTTRLEDLALTTGHVFRLRASTATR